MSLPLNSATEQRLVLLFEGEDLDEARGLLERDCADNVPGWELAGLERLRLAVLKLSGGSLEGLVEAIALAQTDLRDALVAAGFGHRADEHERWWPERGGAGGPESQRGNG